MFRKLEKGRRDDIFMDLVVSFDGSLHAYTKKGGEGYLLANRKGVSFSPYNYRVLEDLELAVSSLLVAPHPHLSSSSEGSRRHPKLRNRLLWRYQSSLPVSYTHLTLPTILRV